MRTTSYFVFAFLFTVLLFISGCNNDNLTTPTSQTNSQTSGNPVLGENITKPSKNSGGELIDGCAGCTVTFYCYGAGTSTPMQNVYVDIYQSSTYITTVGPTDSTGHVSVIVGTFSPGSTTADAYTLNHFFEGGAVFTHSQQHSYTVDIEMWEMGKD